ncbi:MAG: antibiotic biosynthesis monooxygenase [Actinomycetota bacterium]
MTGPFIAVFTYTIKPGKLEEARKRCGELVDFVETNEPRMIAFHLFLDEEGSKLTVVQVHPDAASMEFHLQVNAKHFATAFDYLDKQLNEQYYGPMSEALAAELSKWDEPGRKLIRMPVHEAGFTRTNVR